MVEDLKNARRRRVGIVGVGKMGEPIGRRVLDEGHHLVVPARSAAAVERLRRNGADVAADVDEVVDASEVVLLLLPGPEEAAAVIDRLIEHARPDHLIIEHGTVGRAAAQRAHLRFSDRDVAYLDAPISGGPAGAAAGTLTAMVGGSADTLARAREVIDAYCSTVRLCGSVGTGQAVKLVNQLLVALHTAASAEAAAFGAALGVDPVALLEVLAASFGASRMVERNLPRIASRDFGGATPVSVILKDLGLIDDESAGSSFALPLGAFVREMFRDAVAAGIGDDDMAGIVRLWERCSPRTTDDARSWR
jgi:2-hydroxy-3-oxopropionate reductase